MVESKSLLIKGGRVIESSSGTDEVLDIYIEDGKIKKLGKNLKISGVEVVDAKGKIVLPGFIDMHTHLREPGREDVETILSGSKAAVYGGFTSICCMPNTTPPIDNASTLEYIIERARGAHCNVYPVGTITKGRRGEELSEMAELKNLGAVGFSDDGRSVKDSLLMRRAMEYSLMLDAPILSHCEDETLSVGGCMNEGYTSTILGLPGIPKESEEIIVIRDLFLAELTGARLHICHVSTKRSVELIREAKRRGVKVTCEVTPHHFTLTEEAVTSFDTNTKVNPPLRTEEDIRAIEGGLKDGTIDVIASDHAPHLITEKEYEYQQAPFGMIGLQTALPLVMRQLVEKRILTLPEAVAKLTCNPAKILNLPKGTIKVGRDADLTILDTEKEWIFKPEEIQSLSKNSPFTGWEFKGKLIYTIVAGRVEFCEEGI
ncbi:MAG TPA: dihydroorotase [Candidatus Omnitrophica bacterium]|nr:dihydroorotase [Candidatus Omnitrophota bacterium]